MEVVHVVNFAPTRKQLKLLVAREAGEVHKLELQELSFDPAATWARQLLTLDGAQAQRLVGMLRAVDNLPLAEGETQRLDDAVIEAVFSDTDAVNRLYGPIRSAFGLSSRTTRQRATSSQWRGDAPQLNAFAGCWTTPSSSRLNAPLAQGERGDSRVSQEVCW